MVLRLQSFICVIGNFSLDLIYSSRGFFRFIGGTPFYTGLTVSSLGVETGIVSNLGEELTEYLGVLRELDMRGVRFVKKSTVFEHRYLDGERVSRVICKGEPLIIDQIPEVYLKADIMHLGSIIQEIGLNMVEYIRENSTGLVSLDGQGFVRFPDEEGRIAYRGETLLKAAELVDFVKLSSEEAAKIWGTPRETCEALLDKEVRVCIVTMGEKGVYASTRKREIKVPGLKIREVKDSTGAGDVFTGGMLVSLLKKKNLKDALIMGEAAATASLTGRGVHAIPSKENVLSYHSKIVRGVLKEKNLS